MNGETEVWSLHRFNLVIELSLRWAWVIFTILNAKWQLVCQAISAHQALVLNLRGLFECKRPIRRSLIFMCLGQAMAILDSTELRHLMPGWIITWEYYH